MSFHSVWPQPSRSHLHLPTLSAFLSLGEEGGFVMRILQDLFEDEKATSASVLKCKHDQGGWKAFALM